MGYLALFVYSLLCSGCALGEILIRDVQQTVQSNPVEELQQLLGVNEEQVGHLNDVGPEEHLVHHSTTHAQSEVGDTAAQIYDVEIQSDELPAQQQEDDHGLLYEMPGPGATDLVKIELNREQCNEESVIRCFEPLNQSLQREDPEQFCRTAKSAVECVTELADICADEPDRDEVQQYLNLMGNEVQYLCGSDKEDEYQAQLEQEAAECLEGEIGYELILSRCGNVASEQLNLQKEEEELTPSDVLCLSYKLAASCATNVAEEKCGKAVGQVVYSQLMDAINRFDAMKESSFCNFTEDEAQEPEAVDHPEAVEQSESMDQSEDDDDSQQQQQQELGLGFNFLLKRRRRHATL